MITSAVTFDFYNPYIWLSECNDVERKRFGLTTTLYLLDNPLLSFGNPKRETNLLRGTGHL